MKHYRDTSQMEKELFLEVEKILWQAKFLSLPQAFFRILTIENDLKRKEN